MRIWNLTPHAMHYDDGLIQRTFPSEGALRLTQLDEPDEAIDGLATVRSRYGTTTGLPDGIGAGDVILVSTLLGDAWPASERPEGVIVLVPDTGATCKRDETGRIVSVSRFIRK